MTEARKAFDEMLAENSFVEFWGRLGKIGGEGVDGGIEGGIALDDLGESEVNSEGPKVDMKALAKNVDIKEMERVLKVRWAAITSPYFTDIVHLQNDKRYIMFDHISEERERWLRVSFIPGVPQFCELTAHIGLSRQSICTKTLGACRRMNFSSNHEVYFCLMQSYMIWT